MAFEVFSRLPDSLVGLAVRATCPSIDREARLAVFVTDDPSATCVADILPRLQTLRTLEVRIDCVKDSEQKAAHRLMPRHFNALLHSTCRISLLVSLSIEIFIPVPSRLKKWRRLLAGAIPGLPALQQLELTMTPNAVYDDRVEPDGVEMLTLAIPQLSELTSLKLTGSLLCVITAHEAIQQLTSLQALHLSDRQQVHRTLSRIVESVPQLTLLSLSEIQDCWNVLDPITDVALRHRASSFGAGRFIEPAIGSLAHLQVLQITADMPSYYLPIHCMTDPLPHPLTDCKQLSRIEFIQITLCHTLPLLLYSLSRLPALQHLRVEVHDAKHGRCKPASPKCQKAAPQVFAEAAHLQQLTFLRLSGFNMPRSDASVMGMVDALARLKNLRKLQMPQLWIGDDDDSDAATNALRLLHRSVVEGCEIEFGCNLGSISMARALQATSKSMAATKPIHLHVPDVSDRYDVAVIANTLKQQTALVHLSLSVPGGSANAHRRGQLLAAVAKQCQLTRLELVFRDPGLDDAALEQTSMLLASLVITSCEGETCEQIHDCGAGGSQCSPPERPWDEARDGQRVARGLAQLEVLDMSGCHVSEKLTSLDPLLPLLTVLPRLTRFVRPGRQWLRGVPAAAELAWRQNVNVIRQGLEVIDV